MRLEQHAPPLAISPAVSRSQCLKKPKLCREYLISLFPATEGVVAEFDAHPSISRPLATMLSTLRHRGGKRKVGESGAAADEGPDDGDGYAVKMLQRLLDVANPRLWVRLCCISWPLYAFLAEYYLYSFCVFFPYSCPK